MKSLTILLGFVCLLSIPACDYQRANDTVEPGSTEALQLTLQQSINQVIVPTVSNFKTQSGNLLTQANTFCSNVDQTNLGNLQAQWKTLSLRWNKLVIYNIGPLDDSVTSPTIYDIESMRQLGNLYLSDVRSELLDRLADSSALNTAYFNSLRINEVGMLALEVLIFEVSDSQSTLAANIVTDYTTHPRKCDYLLGITELLIRHADYIESSWTTEFADSGKSFRDTMIEADLLDNGEEPLSQLITMVQQHLDYVKRRKLDTGGTLDASIADYFYENIGATLDEIEQLMQGADGQTYTFFGHMADAGYNNIVNNVRTNLANARQAVAAENRSNLTTAIGALESNLKTDVATALAIDIGATFSDGD